MPCRPSAWVAGLVDEAGNLIEGEDVFSVLSESEFDLGLFEHSVDTAESVRLRVGHIAEAVEGVAEVGQRLAVGPAALGLFCGQDRIIHRLFRLVAPTKMQGQ